MGNEIYIENITPSDITIIDLGIVIVSGAFIDLTLYCESFEISKSTNILPYIDDGSILVYSDPNKIGGSLIPTNAKLHLNIQTEYIDSIEETNINDIISDIDDRVDYLEQHQATGNVNISQIMAFAAAHG